MATVAGSPVSGMQRMDVLVGTPRAHAIDRWIFVFMALWFIAITLTGFIPDSIMKVEMVKAGLRPPFPLILHAHAVVMGSFLLVLMAQTWLMATGKRAYHMQLGLVGYALAAVLVIVGFMLVPTMYGQVWDGAHNGPPQVREMLQKQLPVVDNIALLQYRIGILFPLFLAIAFRARGRNAGMHKRMMFLGTVMAMPAAFVAYETGAVAKEDPQFDLHEPFPGSKVGMLLADGFVVRLAPLSLTAWATPGHAPGSTSWSWRSCEGRRCLNFVYADSISAVSSDTYKYSKHRRYVVTFRDSIRNIGRLRCDVLITPHPGASNLYDRLAGKAPLVDRNGDEWRLGRDRGEGRDGQPVPLAAGGECDERHPGRKVSQDVAVGLGRDRHAGRVYRPAITTDRPSRRAGPAGRRGPRGSARPGRAPL